MGQFSFMDAGEDETIREGDDGACLPPLELRFAWVGMCFHCSSIDSLEWYGIIPDAARPKFEGFIPTCLLWCPIDRGSRAAKHAKQTSRTRQSCRLAEGGKSIDTDSDNGHAHARGNQKRVTPAGSLWIFIPVMRQSRGCSVRGHE